MIKVKLSNWKSDHQMDEAYKALRTNIQFCGADKKVIALTSCTPNEGKSSVAFNLAASLAESGKSVLLIDADLRKSVLMGRVTVDQEVMGLAHYLSKQAKLSVPLHFRSSILSSPVSYLRTRQSFSETDSSRI